MSALLTDAMLSDICHKNIGVQGATGAVAREVRSIYEARLAEREKLWRKLFEVGGLPISASSIDEYEKLCEALGLERG